jgi:signal transduction histidine kinase
MASNTIFAIVRTDSRAFSIGRSASAGSLKLAVPSYRSNLSRILCVGILCYLLGLPEGSLAVETGQRGPLTEVRQARALSVAAISEGRLVEFEGVVTYLRNTSKGQFNFNLNDQTGGVMVYPPQLIPLQPGQRVRVKGITAFSREGLRITASHLEPGPVDGLPEPAKLDLEALRLPQNHGVYAEVEATVRCSRLELPFIQPRRLAIDIGRGREPLTAWILHFDEQRDAFAPGSKVRLRGAVLHWMNPRGHAQSVSLMMNSVDDVQVLELPVNPPKQTIDEVLHWNGSPKALEQISTSGTVTFASPGDLLVIQDGKSALRVRTLSRESLGVPQISAAIGDHIEVIGFPAFGEYSVELEDALIHAVRPGDRIAPQDFASIEAVLGREGLADRDGSLIRLSATVVNFREKEGGTAIELISGNGHFAAVLSSNERVPGFLQPGAEVRLCGVCTLLLTEGRRRVGVAPDQFSLMIPDAGDIELLRAAPWWTQERLRIALGGLCGVAGFAGVLAFAVGRKNRVLKLEIARREAAESRLFSERARMASDLHDNLQQTLLAASLQLNAATRTVEDNPSSAAGRVALAEQLLSRSRKEVKEAVWDLQFGAAQSQRLSDLLRKECEEVGGASSAQIRLLLPENEPLLPAPFLVQALRIARESLANALKHAGATEIRLIVAIDAGALDLTVADNGRGFDASGVPGPSAGHFGLSNMAERAKRLGGTLQISRNEEGGASVRARLPLPS